MVTKQSKKSWPKITTGTHLTVTEYEDGRTELKWDDDALLNEVRNAILKAESVMPVSTKVVPTKKKAAPKKAKVEEPKTKRKTKEKQ
jgi:hypothetical protein